MLFEFKHGENEYTVNVEEIDGGLRVTLNNESYDIDAREISPGRINLLKDGTSRTVHIAGADGVIHLDIDGVKYHIDEYVEGEDSGGGGVADELAKGGILVMPMPGKIIKVNVSEGDAVVAGQILVIIESMKMEQNIKTPVTGTVKSVHVTEGQQVDLEKALIEVEPEEEGEKDQ